MDFPLSASQIASLLHVPEENVGVNWPLIQNGLEAFGLTGMLTQVAAIATVRIESPPFKPVTEAGSQGYFARYDGRKELGNIYLGDGFKFRGRGFIQITGRWGYEHFGKIIGVDLVSNPDLALEPAASAVILAAYFKERHVAEKAEAKDWEGVRRAVNGGLNGLDDFLFVVNRLLSAAA